jgi:hypothetical protein
MREGFVRTMEALVAVVATYMAAVTMVQTTLYNKILTKISNSVIGPLVQPYLPYFNIAVIIAVLFVCFTFWRKGDEVWFGRLFSLNMLMFFPSVLDFSTFNWVGLIFDLTPTPGVTHLWVFGVGLILQITYLMLRYTVRFRYVRDELSGRGADEQDINDITRGQVSYLVLLTTITGGLTAGIYVSVPYMTKIAQAPLTGLPVPHMLIGFLVVVFIAAAMIMYLRAGSE